MGNNKKILTEREKTSEERDKEAPIAQAIIAYRSLFWHRENNINRTSLFSLYQEYFAKKLLQIAQFFEQFFKKKLQKSKNRKGALELKKGWPTRGL